MFKSNYVWLYLALFLRFDFENTVTLKSGSEQLKVTKTATTR